MIRINLLPYRAEKRRGQIMRYIVVAAVTLGVTVVLALSSYTWSAVQLASAKDDLSNLQNRNHILRKRIGELSKFKTVQAEVQKKLDLVDQLQRGRFRSLRTLQGLSAAIPKNVWLTQVLDNGGSISISGVGESNRAVSSFMRALEEQKVFSGVSLGVIKRQSSDGVALRSFSLTMNRVDQTPPAKGKQAKGKGS